MSEVKVNKISPRTNCGTVQLGDSGDTITIPAGATIVNNGTQTGFGRTGTVNWDTTAKTASFTAVSGNGYFVNTTSGAITVTLPASPSAGDIVSVSDYAGTATTNNITIARNGSNFEGSAYDGVISTNRQAVTLIYVDATQGWVPTSENDSSFQQALYVTATGGTITTCGDYKIHTFTGPGTFCISCSGNPAGNVKIDYLVVAGGAGGSAGNPGAGGGGGAGGFRESQDLSAAPFWTASPLKSTTSLGPLSGAIPVTVGGGGAGGDTTAPCNTARSGTNGSNSTFSTITSAGGGAGSVDTPVAPGNGGSGGGAANVGVTAGTGNTPPVSPPQGNNGGGGFGCGPWYPAGGGGGAGGAGASLPAPAHGGPGGDGLQINIDTNTYYWAGGGGGAAWTEANGGNGGLGGGGGGATHSATAGSGGGCALNPGGAGGGSWPSNSAGGSGGANTGGGAGGSNCTPVAKGNGGSGIVIIRYKYQ